MKFDIREYSKSNTAALTAGLTYILISKLFDKITGPRISNIIGLLSGSTINFVMQSYIFKCENKITQRLCAKYVVSELIIATVNQILFLSFYNKKCDITLTRIIIALIVGLCVSYSLRKHWVFNWFVLAYLKSFK